MADLSNKFTARQEFSKYFGVMGVKVVEDEGVPVVNPSRATLAKFLDGFDEEGDERKYTGASKISWGWTDLAAEGGKKRFSEDEYNKLGPAEQEGGIVEEVDYVKVTLLVETQDDNKMRKLITFRFFNAPQITKSGEKRKVFNKFGKTTYAEVDGTFGSEKFEDEEVRGLPMSTGHLDFEDLIDFIYAYSTLNRKTALMSDLDMEAILTGDVTSIVNLITDIHEGIKTSKGKPGYGAAVLFTVENNKGTGGEFRQSYYHKFERWVMDDTGKINQTFSQITKEIANERKPNKKTGRSYSPESQGIFVGVNGLPKLGLKEFKSRYMDNIMTQQAQGAINTATAVDGGLGAADDNPFGDVNDVTF
jgi:hypothetical protein